MGVFNLLSERKVKEVKLEDVEVKFEGQRNSSALEAVTSKVMIADENNIIVKINSAAIKMMQDAESDLRQVLPNFSTATLLGSNIDVFHKNPEHQRGMLKTLSSTYHGQIIVGSRTFELTASPLFNTSNRRIGTVVEWEDISEKLKLQALEDERIQKEKITSDENNRLKSALDVASSNVMVADEDNIIVYVNHSVQVMLNKAEEDIKEALPNFDAKNVVGNSVDVFHKNPAHQKSKLAALGSEFKTEINVGERVFSLIANPIVNDSGERQGTVVEWNDRTAELAFENVVDETLELAIAGKLNDRIDLDGRSGFIAKVGSGLNSLLDVFEEFMSDVGTSISEISEGHLTRKIENDYKGSFGTLKDDINSTIEKLVGIMSEISDTAINVKDSSQEISTGNSNLSQRTEEQAASLEETSAAMEQITTTVQQNAANAMQAATLARSAREAAENGGSIVSDAVKAMEMISESSNTINDIIDVIEKISFQTNLLALNAAVEAARAGDQGRGFAVVADEVRSLAGRSATAAKEIKGLIKVSGERVHEGSVLVNKSGDTLQEIVSAVKKVNDVIAEISTASDEQSSGLDEINTAVGQMDVMTQQNSSLVDDAAASSEALGEQAVALERLISFFVTGHERSRKSQVKKAVQAKPEVKPEARSEVKAKPNVIVSQTTSADDNNEGDDWTEF